MFYYATSGTKILCELCVAAVSPCEVPKKERSHRFDAPAVHNTSNVETPSFVRPFWYG